MCTLAHNYIGMIFTAGVRSIFTLKADDFLFFVLNIQPTLHYITLENYLYLVRATSRTTMAT